MYYIKVSNRDNCILAIQKTKDYSNNTLMAILNEYTNPESIHIDIEDYETGRYIGACSLSDVKPLAKEPGQGRKNYNAKV